MTASSPVDVAAYPAISVIEAGPVMPGGVVSAALRMKRASSIRSAVAAKVYTAGAFCTLVPPQQLASYQPSKE